MKQLLFSTFFILVLVSSVFSVDIGSSEGEAVYIGGNEIYASFFEYISTPVVLTSYNPKPDRNAENNIHGGFELLTTNDNLNPTTNIIVSKGTGKMAIIVNDGSDYTGQIKITGTKIDRNTGEMTNDYTDTLDIAELSSDDTKTDGNGNIVHNVTKGYLTSVWFVGNVTLHTTDVTLTDVDTYHVSFEQFNDVPNITLDSFDANIYTTNANAEFDSYLYLVANGNNRLNVTVVASLHSGTNGVTAIANKYWRLRRGNLNQFIDGTNSGIFVDTHYSNSPAYVEDVTLKVWATENTLAN